MTRLVLMCLVAGCALVSRSRPVEVRYFSPEPARVEREPIATSPSPGEATLRLRLARVSPSSHLREPIAHRASPFELGLYAERRWTEQPDAYVRRSVERALFDQRPLVEAASGPAPALEIEVIAFEEVRAPRHVGRVQLRYRLVDDRTVLGIGVVTTEQPVRGQGFGAVAAAIGAALDEAAARLADDVLGRLRAKDAG